jgi:alginate O-acetyltransferase complex protein AlgI
MLFNSISFAIFLPIVFFLYWFATKGKVRSQNILLLVASYFFYACWDWRFLFLLIFSTLLDYYTGIKIHESATQKKSKAWMWLSLIVNLGFLGVFKYYNFFISSFADGLSMAGIQINYPTISVILPVGISFYTFHGISYVLDIYYKRITPERNFINYSVFVSFFPLLVAGPIERATHLLPQIIRERKFEYSRAVDGLRQILWGLFKKIVIADNCAEYANQIFNNSESYHGGILILGAVLFAFQIYGDFSGYSDMALGTARLFGIDLLRNFAYPYFSRDIAEFWRRWHISLSSWFRDYLYIPLGGSQGGKWMKVRNTFIIFLVSGFWHGANWTFIVWGFLNALFIMPAVLLNTNRNNLDIVAKGRILPNVRELLAMLTTFLLTCLAWIFFRADSVTHAFSYIRGIFKGPFLEPFDLIPPVIYVLLGAFVLTEWYGREYRYALEKFNIKYNRFFRWSVYYMIIILLFLFKGNTQQFIYFQF